MKNKNYILGTSGNAIHFVKKLNNIFKNFNHMQIPRIRSHKIQNDLIISPHDPTAWSLPVVLLCHVPSCCTAQRRRHVGCGWTGSRFLCVDLEALVFFHCSTRQRSWHMTNSRCDFLGFIIQTHVSPRTLTCVVETTNKRNKQTFNTQ